MQETNSLTESRSTVVEDSLTRARTFDLNLTIMFSADITPALHPVHYRFSYSNIVVTRAEEEEEAASRRRLLGYSQGAVERRAR